MMECARSSEFCNDGMCSELSVIQGITECVEVRGWVRRESPDKSLLRCPCFPHLKQRPFFMASVLCSVIIVSTSIAFGSFLEKFQCLFGSSFISFFSGVCPSILCIFLQVLSTCFAHLYHSSNLTSGLSNSIVFLCNFIGNVCLKQSIIERDSFMSV